MGLHNMDIGTAEDLCRHRIQRAKEDLHSAEVLLQVEDYRGCNNRAYYAIFHMINAIHALDGRAYRKHKDAIANFNKAYVKEGIFNRGIGRRIAHAEEIRHASDYDDFYIASRLDSEAQIKAARDFIEIAEGYCLMRIKSR